MFVYLTPHSTFSWPYLTIEGQFLPQSMDLHYAILHLPKLTAYFTIKVVDLVKLSIPQELQETTELGRRSQALTFHTEVWHVAEERQDKPHNPAAAYVFPPSFVQSLLRSHTASQHRRNLAVAVSSDPTPTQQSLPMTRLNTLQ